MFSRPALPLRVSTRKEAAALLLPRRRRKQETVCADERHALPALNHVTKNISALI